VSEVTTKTLEQGFLHFSKEEISGGCIYAQEKCGRAINPDILRWIANKTGGIRARDLDIPLRDAIEEAVRSYEKSARVFFPALECRAYVRSVGHMFGERNPTTLAKRAREMAEEVNYGLDDASDIDPKTNDEIARGLTGHPLEADV
jgi:hypothetical protein